MDRAVGGSPAPAGPSRLGAVQQRSVAIASLFGNSCPVYATPAENIRAAQAAADELDNFEGEELRLMMERVQQLLDAAAAQNEAGCRAEAPQRPVDDLHRDQGSMSRTPIGGARGRRDKEPTVSHSRTHITIERDRDGRPRAVERRDDCLPPPPRKERRVSPPLDRPTSPIPSAGRRRRVGSALFQTPHSRRALSQRVHAPKRHAQVYRLREAGRLASRLLHSCQHRKRQQACRSKVHSSHAPGHGPDMVE